MDRWQKSFKGNKGNPFSRRYVPNQPADTDMPPGLHWSRHSAMGSYASSRSAGAPAGPARGTAPVPAAQGTWSSGSARPAPTQGPPSPGWGIGGPMWGSVHSNYPGGLRRPPVLQGSPDDDLNEPAVPSTPPQLSDNNGDEGEADNVQESDILQIQDFKKTQHYHETVNRCRNWLAETFSTGSSSSRPRAFSEFPRNSLIPQAPPAPLAPRTPLPPQASSVPLAPFVHQASRVPLAPFASQTTSVPLAPLAPQASSVPLAELTPQASMLTLAPLAPQVPSIPLTPLGPQASSVPLASLDPQAVSAPLAPLAPRPQASAALGRAPGDGGERFVLHASSPPHKIFIPPKTPSGRELPKGEYNYLGQKASPQTRQGTPQRAGRAQEQMRGAPASTLYNYDSSAHWSHQNPGGALNLNAPEAYPRDPATGFSVPELLALLDAELRGPNEISIEAQTLQNILRRPIPTSRCPSNLTQGTLPGTFPASGINLDSAHIQESSLGLDNVPTNSPGPLQSHNVTQGSNKISGIPPSPIQNEDYSCGFTCGNCGSLVFPGQKGTVHESTYSEGGPQIPLQPGTPCGSAFVAPAANISQSTGDPYLARSQSAHSRQTRPTLRAPTQAPPTLDSFAQGSSSPSYSMLDTFPMPAPTLGTPHMPRWGMGGAWSGPAPGPVQGQVQEPELEPVPRPAPGSVSEPVQELIPGSMPEPLTGPRDAFQLPGRSRQRQFRRVPPQPDSTWPASQSGPAQCARTAGRSGRIRAKKKRMRGHGSSQSSHTVSGQENFRKD